MKFGHLAAVDATGSKPDGSKAEVPADPEFLPALFKAEVGEDSDPFATKAGAYFAAACQRRDPAQAQAAGPGARPGASPIGPTSSAASLLATKARALAAQAAKDKSLDGIAKELKVAGAAQPGAEPRHQ